MPGPKYKGWHWDAANSRLDVYIGETEAAYFKTSASPYLTIANGCTITAGGQTITAGGQTITAGGQTITAGGQVISAGSQHLADGQLIRLGTAAATTAFGTAAGTNGILFAAGTAPNGTCTNCCQLYSDNSGDDLSVEHADGSEDELTT